MAAAAGNKYNAKYSEEDIDLLCIELLDFAENHKSIHFAKFCRMKGFYKSWLLKMCDHHPKLKEAYDEAKELMAAKIGDLCFYDKESGVNANFGKDNLFRYDNEWVAHIKWRAEIQKEQPAKEENKSAFNQWKEEQKSDQSPQ